MGAGAGQASMTSASCQVPLPAQLVDAPVKDARLDPARTIKSGAALLIGTQLIKLCLQLGSTAILARLLLPADFGLISLVTPITAFFTVFRDIGLTSATIFSKDISAAEVTSLFWINSGVGLALAAILVIAAPAVGLFYADSRLGPMLSVMAATFVFNGVAAQYQAVMQRSLRFKTLAAIDLGSNVFGTALSVWAAFHGFGYWSLVVMPVASQAMSLLATIPVSHWQPGRPRWEPRTGSMAKFGSSIAGFNVLNYFARNVDNLLIGKVWGMEALGYYGRAYTLMMLPLTQLMYPLSQVTVPVLTRINADRELYRSTYRSIMKVVMFCCVPLVTTVIVARRWIIDILLGPNWQGIAPIFLLLGLSALVQPMNNSAGWLMVSQGRSKEILAWGFIGSGITVLFILVGLPFGIAQVAASYSFGQIFVLTPVLWWYATRNRMVTVRDLLSVSWPFWAIAAVSSITFEYFAAWQFEDRGNGWPVVELIVAACWVFGLQVLVLACHPAGRRLLRTVAQFMRNRSMDTIGGA
jgi:O-antigen/teichoic acid export membrane protein